mgnify:CR=1 FL=1
MTASGRSDLRLQAALQRQVVGIGHGLSVHHAGELPLGARDDGRWAVLVLAHRQHRVLARAAERLGDAPAARRALEAALAVVDWADLHFALGTLLVVGFMLHNATEGLAIVAPLARVRVRVVDLLVLGVIGGAPTIAGALLGGLFYSPVWSVLFLAMGAGAIAQVLAQIAVQVAGDRPMRQFLATAPALAGLFAGFGVMYATGMIVG